MEKVKRLCRNKFFLPMFGLLFFMLWHAQDVFLVASLKEEMRFIKGEYLFLCFFLFVTVLLSAYFFLRPDGQPQKEPLPGTKKGRNPALPICFLILSLLLGTGYLFVFRGISAPDEISHYIGSYRLSSMLLGEEAVVDTGHVIVREEDYFLEDLEDLADGMPEDEYTPKILGRNLQAEDFYIVRNWDRLYPRSDKIRVSRHSPVRTTPLIYIPQILGISLARILKLNSMGLITLGKLLNLIAYALLLSYAIYLLPFGKKILFAAALLPMSVHLGASMSYDAMIIALVSVFLAKVFSIAYEKEKAGLRDILLLALLAAVFSPCKMIYSLLIFSYLIIGDEKFRSKAMKYGGFALILCAFAVSMFWVNAATIESYATAGSNNLEWAGEAGYTIRELIRRPLFTMRMFYHTLLWQAQYYHMTMIGAYLGNIDEALDIPYILIQVFSLGLLLLSLRGGEGKNPMKPRERLWIGLLLLAVIGAALLSMFIAWTPRNADTILGVQGRYFLPLLPPALLLLDNPCIIRRIKNIDALLFVFIWSNAYALARLYSIVCLRIEI